MLLLLVMMMMLNADLADSSERAASLHFTRLDLYGGVSVYLMRNSGDEAGPSVTCRRISAGRRSSTAVYRGPSIEVPAHNSILDSRRV